MQRGWVLDLLPPSSGVGRAWLRNIYLTQLGESDGNWQRCFAADRWITDRNRDCRRRYWPGCDREHTEVGERRARTPAGLVADHIVARPTERTSR